MGMSPLVTGEDLAAGKPLTCLYAGWERGGHARVGGASPTRWRLREHAADSVTCRTMYRLTTKPSIVRFDMYWSRERQRLCPLLFVEENFQGHRQLSNELKLFISVNLPSAKQIKSCDSLNKRVMG